MLTNNNYLRGIRAIFNNDIISLLRYSDYKSSGCDKFLTTKEYVDKKINEDCDVGTFFSVNGKLVAYNSSSPPSNPNVGDFYSDDSGKLFYCSVHHSWDDDEYSDTSNYEINLLFSDSSSSFIVSFYDKNSDNHFSNHKVNYPEIGQICLFTYDYEPGKANSLRIYADNTTKWDDLFHSGKFDLLRENSDYGYLSLSYSFDKYNSRIVNMQISPFIDDYTINQSFINVNSNTVSILNPDSSETNEKDVCTVSSPISTIINYYSYSGTSLKSDIRDTYNVIQFNYKGPLVLNGDNSTCVYETIDNKHITIVGTYDADNDTFVPKSLQSPYSTPDVNDNDIILVNSIKNASSTPVESNVNYPFLISSVSDQTSHFIHKYPSSDSDLYSYDKFFIKDLSLLCKFTISPITSGSSTTNMYSIKLISSSNGPYLANNYLNNSFVTISDDDVWLLENSYSLSYIKS